MTYVNVTQHQSNNVIVPVETGQQTGNMIPCHPSIIMHNQIPHCSWSSIKPDWLPEVTCRLYIACSDCSQYMLQQSRTSDLTALCIQIIVWSFHLFSLQPNALFWDQKVQPSQPSQQSLAECFRSTTYSTTYSAARRNYPFYNMMLPVIYS